MNKYALTLLFVASSAFAGEGMWMPQQLPQIAADVQKMGAKFDPNRLAKSVIQPARRFLKILSRSIELIADF